MSSATHRFAPLTDVQRQRLEAMVDALTDAYRLWLKAEAVEAPEGERLHLKKRYHAIRSLHEVMQRTRGLRKGDTVRMFTGAHAGTSGVVVRHQAGMLMLVEWPEDSQLRRLGLPHAWQLELIEPLKETKEKT